MLSALETLSKCLFPWVTLVCLTTLHRPGAGQGCCLWPAWVLLITKGSHKLEAGDSGDIIQGCWKSQWSSAERGALGRCPRRKYLALHGPVGRSEALSQQVPKVKQGTRK